MSNGSEILGEEAESGGLIEQRLDCLTDIFPYISRSSLLQSIESHREKLLEQLVEMLMTDSEPAPVEQTPVQDKQQKLHKKLKDPEIQTLKEILPKHSMAEIEYQYQLHNGDFDLIVRTLLEKERQTVAQKDTQFLAQELSSLTGRSVQLATTYLLKNEGHFVRSLIDIVGSETRIERETSSKIQRRPSRLTYDASKPEFRELEALYASNNELRALYKPFLIKLVALLQGDFSKLVDICASIQESHLQEMTFSVREKELEESLVAREKQPEFVPAGSKSKPTVGKIKLPEAARKLQAMQQQTSSPRAGASARSTPTYTRSSTKRVDVTSEDYKRTQQALADCRARGGLKLDLHGLLVDSAMHVATQELRQWWQSELQHREHAGRLDKYGARAQFMEPFVVVTGRGIHSKDGVSPIRVQVQKYLREIGFQYNEESWGFVVYGKITE